MTKKVRVTGEEALAAAYAAHDHQPLLEALGVSLPDHALRHALTHRSFANEHDHLPNNERLEFLGDAVVGLSVANQLYQQYPSRPESDLSKMRASIVSRFGLADIAREIGLGPYILLGKGETATGGADKDSILADTTEAIVGAIYLEHGFEIARDVVVRLARQRIDHASAQALHQDWKTTLTEGLSQRHLPCADYRTEVTGPAHDQLFTAQAIIQGTVFGTGTGQSKKQAEQAAAHEAYKKLSDVPPTDLPRV